MQVSLEWLNEYIDITDLSAEQIAHELTMSGLEVEEIEKTAVSFKNIITAEILEIKPHPNADKLQIAKIFNGTETREVVCGAKNIAKGQVIPYASVGSEVKDRKTGESFALKPAVIRGVESEGMLCSAEELGLKTENYQNEDGILILNSLQDNVKAGLDVKEVLNLSEDTILHVAPTANRGDEMSIIGIARELSAIFNRKLCLPVLKESEISKNPDFSLEIKNEDTCKYYALGILKDVKIGASPDWMIKRLLSSGVRSINNVVDITNYVMLEYGQPLHAFDMDKIDGNYLCVRRANENETLITLDEQERRLSYETVVIAGKEKSVGLAGLMGGFNSEIDDKTTNIALESAYFTPHTNRRSARSVGLRTEACARFERGVDIESVKPALIRAIQLMQELANAKVEGVNETGNNKLTEIHITLRFSQIKRILGIEIAGAKCIEILENLGFTLLGKNDFSAKFLVPSYRANDVTREIDLIEEIARIYGYDKIEPSLPGKTIALEISKDSEFTSKIHKIFQGNGFYEAVSSSLTGEPLLNWIGIDYDKEKAVKVSNPQSDEHTMLRQSLIPNIVQMVKYNFDMGQKNVWLYEIGKTFLITGNPTYRETGVTEKRILAGAVTGNITSGKWKGESESDFYALKGVIESLFRDLNIDNRVEYQSINNISYLHPGRAAEIKLLSKNSVSLGLFGELHPQINEKCKLSQPVYIFEIDLENLLTNLAHITPRYKQLPSYPAVQRDIAFIVPESLSNQEISKVIKKSASSLFKKSEIFDVYQGQHVEKGFKSLAYRITLQDPSGTLVDEKIDAEMLKVREGLKKSCANINFRE